MTPVNSSLGTPPTSFVNYEQAKFQDGDIVLLAIALEQANSAKETLKSQAEAMAANVLAKAKTQEAVQELQAAKAAVVAQELAAVDEQIAAIEAAKAEGKPIGAKADGSPDEFAQFAADRNLPAATYIPANGDHEAVGSPTAYDQNIAMLKAYRASVANGTADNLALQDAIASDPATQSAMLKLNSLGVAGEIVSLGDFQTMADRGGEAVVTLQSAAEAARSALDRIIDSVNATATDIEKLSSALRKDRDGLLDKFQDLGRQTKTADTTKSQRLLETTDEYRAFADAVDRVDDVLSRYGLGPDVASRIIDSLPADQQSEVSRAVDQASQALQKLLENSRPNESRLDSPRRIRV